MKVKNLQTLTLSICLFALNGLLGSINTVNMFISICRSRIVQKKPTYTVNGLINKGAYIWVGLAYIQNNLSLVNGCLIAKGGLKTRGFMWGFTVLLTTDFSYLLSLL